MPKHAIHSRRFRVGCVSYLNARPLVDGLQQRASVEIIDAVPAALLEMLLSGEVDLALCPVIDFQSAPEPLEIVPSGAIGCDGPTMTVKLYSAVPIDQISSVHADTDSHTSRVLVQIILRKLLDRAVPVLDLERSADHPTPPSLLLIGDKVVNQAPPRDTYPYTLDLGSAWHSLTGLPFVFAVWMTRANTELGDLPRALRETMLANQSRIDEIVQAYAPERGWTFGLADQYLGRLLHYDVQQEQLVAMQRFWEEAASLGIITKPRPLLLHPSGSASATPGI